MYSIKILMMVFFLFLVCAANQTIQAQTDSCPTNNYVRWLNCKVEELVTADANQRAPNKQVQTPSISEATTSLVDQTDVPDLAGLALNFAGLNSGSNDQSKNVNSITTSAYAIYAASSRNDPLDPAFYRKYSNLRKFSFTFGREAADESNSNQSSTIAGFKVRIINRRNASRDDNLRLLEETLDQTAQAGVDFSRTFREVRDYIYQQFATSLNLPVNPTSAQIETFQNEQLNGLISKLSKEQKDEITRIMKTRISSEIALANKIQTTIETIRRKPQLSFTFQSKLRGGDKTDEYRTGVVYDQGIVNKLNLAINGTLDYKNSKVIGGDSRGGRIAAEAYYQLTPEKKLYFTGKDPLLLSFASEGKWMSGKSPTYQGQVKLTIPIFDGINIPVSVTYANRTDLIKESTVRGNFGFTFDLAKALKGFKP